jgi:hypothetical protein
MRLQVNYGFIGLQHGLQKFIKKTDEPAINAIELENKKIIRIFLYYFFTLGVLFTNLRIRFAASMNAELC